MTQHTKGPWVIRTLENFGFNVVHYINGDKFDIARVAKCGSEADARLIAAAPDGLELAQEFLAFAMSGANFIYPAGSLQKLEQFIAKATS